MFVCVCVRVVTMIDGIGATKWDVPRPIEANGFSSILCLSHIDPICITPRTLYIQ
jgi:hypothetical protein